MAAIHSTMIAHEVMENGVIIEYCTRPDLDGIAYCAMMEMRRFDGVTNLDEEIHFQQVFKNVVGFIHPAPDFRMLPHNLLTYNQMLLESPAWDYRSTDIGGINGVITPAEDVGLDVMYACLPELTSLSTLMCWATEILKIHPFESGTYETVLAVCAAYGKAITGDRYLTIRTTIPEEA